MRLLRQLAVILLIVLPTVNISWAQTSVAAGCVENYEPGTDYFPDKSRVEYAAGFAVEYFDNYKVVEVLTPWVGADETYTYVLVQCGTPAPEGFDDATIVEVPVESIVVMSTTYLPPLVELDLLDTLVAVDEHDFVYSPEVRERIESGEVVEVGGGSLVNVEQVLNLDADLIMTYGIGSPDYDAHPALINAGLNVVLNADYMETSPLGRAEWLKFIALFYNREADANALFDEVVANYEELSALTEAVEDRPQVMVNAMFGDTWYAAGGRSYIAQLIEDAGGDYVWGDDESTGALALSFEAAFDAAQDADIWLNPNFWFTFEEGLAEDERYGDFEAFANGQVYNSNAQVTPLGGNNSGELGAMRPDITLADLIAIFHPELLPDHELVFYRRLE